MSDKPTQDPSGCEPASAGADVPEDSPVTREQSEASGSTHLGVGVTLSIGVALGIVFGTMLDNLGLGLALGAGLGIVVGAILESHGRSD